MELTVAIVWYVGLLVCLVAGLSLAVFQMPGTWAILLCASIYTYFHDFEPLGWPTLTALVVVALLAEAAELVAAAKGASRSGASRQASWGALLGGIAGMIVLAPVPFVGPMLGGFIGCFLGAFLAERHQHGDMRKGAAAGSGAVLGRLAGLIIKTSAAFIMAGTCLGFATYHLFLQMQQAWNS